MEEYKRLCEIQSTQWQCSNCTLFNKKDDLKCVSCNTQKNEATQSKLNKSESEISSQFTFGFNENKADAATPKNTPKNTSKNRQKAEPKKTKKFLKRKTKVVDKRNTVKRQKIAKKSAKKEEELTKKEEELTKKGEKSTKNEEKSTKNEEKSTKNEEKSTKNEEKSTKNEEKSTKKEEKSTKNEKLTKSAKILPKTAKTEKIIPKKEENSKKNLKNLKTRKTILNNSIENLKVELKLNHSALVVFGGNSFGTLGLGEDSEPAIELPIVQKSSVALNFQYITSGAFCMAAIDKNGSIWTWGPNDGGVLGRKTSDCPSKEYEPHKVEFNHSDKEKIKAIKVTVGDEHMAALLKNGSVWSWGSFKDTNGRIGHHVENGKIIKIQETPYRLILPNENIAVDIASGSNHAVILDNFSNIFIFGISNFSKNQSLRSNQGMNSILLKSVYFFYKIKKSIKITNVFCGTHSIYALDNSGEIYSTGLNNFGQLANKVDLKKLNKNGKNHKFCRGLKKIDFKKDFNEKVDFIDGGNHHVLFLTQNKKIYSAGRNASGLLGVKTKEGEKEFANVTPEMQPSSKPLYTGQKATKICCGGDHNLFVAPNGALKGFGFESDFRLGSADKVNVGQFKEIISAEIFDDKLKIEQISAGSQHSAVLIKRIK